MTRNWVERVPILAVWMDGLLIRPSSVVLLLQRFQFLHWRKRRKQVRPGGFTLWAVAIARAQNRASPALLAQQLGISKDAASELYRSMIANGVIRAPMFGGLARAAQLLFKGGHIVAADMQVKRAASAKLKDMKRAFDKFAADDLEPEDQAT